MNDTDRPDPDDVRAAEATGQPLVVEWKGEKYTIPRDYVDWPFEYKLGIEQGRSATAYAALLGDEQFTKFRATQPTISDFMEFDRLVGEALGVAAGESQASSD